MDKDEVLSPFLSMSYENKKLKYFEKLPNRLISAVSRKVYSSKTLISVSLRCGTI